MIDTRAHRREREAPSDWRGDEPIGPRAVTHSAAVVEAPAERRARNVEGTRMPRASVHNQPKSCSRELHGIRRRPRRSGERVAAEARGRSQHPRRGGTPILTRIHHHAPTSTDRPSTCSDGERDLLTHERPRRLPEATRRMHRDETHAWINQQLAAHETNLIVGRCSLHHRRRPRPPEPAEPIGTPAGSQIERVQRARRDETPDAPRYRLPRRVCEIRKAPRPDSA